MSEHANTRSGFSFRTLRKTSIAAIPAKAGIHLALDSAGEKSMWIPAFAAMTGFFEIPFTYAMRDRRNNGGARMRRFLARTLMLVCAAAVALPLPLAQARNDASREASDALDQPLGQRDFDFEFGRWRTHLKLLRNPLSGSTTWVEYSGTSVVSRVWEGRANLVELEVAGAAGRIEGLSLRLYNPQTGQWSLNFSNSRGGTLTPPVYGGFANGRGEFYGQDFLDGRAILVRFVITPLNPNTIRFEQAFSADGGKNWEVNWIATDTRIGS